MNTFNALLKTSAAPADKKGKKKNEAFVVELPAPLSGSVGEFNKQKKAMKEAETAMRVAEGPIIRHCIDEQSKLGLAGEFIGSFTVKDGEDTVKYVSVDKWSVSQDPEVHKELKNLLGEETYGKVIKEEMTVTMKSDVFASDEKQNEFVALMGDRFNDFFETTTTLSVKSGLNEKIFDIAKTPDKLAQICSLLNQTKPSLRS